jgi:hypothetical protein
MVWRRWLLAEGEYMLYLSMDMQERLQHVRERSD